MSASIVSATEGRASAARPSVRVLSLIGTALLLCAVLASSAQAAVTPALIGSNPGSPGQTTTPRIRGDVDGVITAAVGQPAGLSGPILSGLEPEESTIALYAQAKCGGSIVAEGSGKELEGTGILVTVGADTETTFSATQTDSGGTSGCSNPIVYQQVTTPPAPPTLGTSTPASGGNENFPRLTGSSAANSIVFLYPTADCSGPPAASGTAAAFAGAGIQVQVADNSTTVFHALATLAGIGSTCSTASLSYQEVTPPEAPASGGGTGGGVGPATPLGKPKPPSLRTVPGGIANNATPLLAGSAPGANTVRVYASADCSGGVVTKVPAANFQAGLKIAITPNTTSVFSARAVNAAGDSDCSEPVIYIDDSIAPRTKITAGPGIKTLKRVVVFRFADITKGPATSFLCKVDKKPWKACHAPLKLKKLGSKRHTLRVKAYDAAGNREKKGVKRSFQVVTSP